MISKLYINGATAGLLVLLSFGATAGGEFVCEGSRKPYSVRNLMFSNSVEPGQVATLRRIGCVTNDPYPLRNAASLPNDQVRLGARVYRFHCSVCHTMTGMNGVADLTVNWDADQMRMNIAKLQQTKPFMPPFAGTPEELEALVQYLRWWHADQPGKWPVSNDASVIAQIHRWMQQAGPNPAGRRLVHH